MSVNVGDKLNLTHFNPFMQRGCYSGQPLKSFFLLYPFVLSVKAVHQSYIMIPCTAIHWSAVVNTEIFILEASSLCFGHRHLFLLIQKL